jgi:phosphate transport system substrate-binding protein
MTRKSFTNSTYPCKDNAFFTLVLLLSIAGTLFMTSCTATSTTTNEPRGHLLIAGSTALQPLATAAALLYQKQHPQVHIDVGGGGSIYGLQAVTGQKVNIGNSDIYADPAQFPDPNLTDHIVCAIPFTLIVDPAVNVSSLTSQQIIDIFSTGKIRNWRQVGGQNLPIVPVVRPSTSGTRATFRKYIIDGRDENGKLLKADSSATVLDTVAHTPGAIGYLARSVLDSRVKAVAIDGKMATVNNIESGQYAFWGYEHMYTLGENGGLMASFLDFMLTPEVQQLAQKMGYIPIASIKLSMYQAPARTAPSLLSFKSEVNPRESL